MPEPSSSDLPAQWHSFILRVWCETAVFPLRWRVSVRHVSGSDWLVFSTLAEAFIFIENHSTAYLALKE